MKTDFLKFVKRKIKAPVSDVLALNNGHLVNVAVMRQQHLDDLVTRIQAVVRANAARRVAATQATLAAYRDV